MATFCASCGSELTAGAHFCAACGEPAVAACVGCGTELPSGAAFCPACGSAQDSAIEEAVVGGEERRVISALFADLAGFTAHTEASDPEDVRARLSLYHNKVREDVERHGGTIEKLMGDGVFAVFGVPTIHEDDPERAVRAALRIQESVGDLNAADAALDLSVRIGVTTGEAIVQLEAGGADERIIGDVVNTASRLEGIAPPGGVVVDERTYLAVRNAVKTSSLDPVTVKGKAEPMPIWQALEARSRFDVEAEEGAAMVGRREELSLLVDAFERAVARRSPQLVTVSGEPGVGKSRLVREFFKVIDDLPYLVRWRQGRSLPYGEGVTYWALSEVVKAEAGILESEPPADAAAKLERSIAALTDGDDVDADWLRLRVSPLAGTGGTDGVERAELFSAWLTYFELLAAQRPTVIVIEDLHWADDALGDFLEHLVDWAQDAPILVLTTARPEWFSRRPDWGGGKREAVTVGLTPLSAEETVDLITALSDRAVMPAETQQALLERSGGNPLYLTEYLRLAEEHGWLDDSATPTEMALPDTVQAIIAARLDLLDGEDKTLLQTASVVGKVFWSGALTFMLGEDLDSVNDGLQRLARRELVRPIRRSSMQGQHEFTFSHVLARDVAYSQLTKGERARLHLEEARWLEAVSGDRATDVAELLAYHHTTALELEPSDDHERLARVYRFLMLAGERNQSLDLQAAARFYAQAADIAQTPPERGRALLEYATHATADNETLMAAVQEALNGFTAAGDRLGQAAALSRRSSFHWYGGDSDAADADLGRAMELVDGEPLHEVVAQVLTTRAAHLQLAGREEEALDMVERALAVSQTIGDTKSFAKVLVTRGSAMLQLGDADGLDDVVEGLRIRRDIGDTGGAMAAYNNQATYLASVGRAEEALAAIDEAIDYGEQRGAGPGVEWSKMTKCEALFPLGRLEELSLIAAEVEEADEARGGSQVGTFVKGWQAILAHLDNRTDEGWALAEEVLESAREIKDPQAMMPALVSATMNAYASGRTERARDLAAEYVTTATDHPAWLGSLSGVAPVLIALGRADDVELLADLAYDMDRWPPLINGAMRALALQSRGEHAAALPLFEAAIAHGDQENLLLPTIDLRIHAARSAAALGHQEEVEELRARARRDAEHINARRYLTLLDEADGFASSTAVGD